MNVGTFEIIGEGLDKKLNSEMRCKEILNSYNNVRDNTKVAP
jgi:hypothetical protein